MNSCCCSMAGTMACMRCINHPAPIFATTNLPAHWGNPVWTAPQEIDYEILAKEIIKQQRKQDDKPD